MNKSKLCVFLLVLAFAVTSVSAQFINTRIRLTQRRIDKFISTLPGWAKAVKAVGQNTNPSAASGLYQHGKINAFLRSRGWGNPYNFYSVLTKIGMAMAWIAVISNPQLTPEQRRMMEPQLAAGLSQYTAREKALVRRNAARLFRVMKEISSDNN